jgi:hypothetical protein
MRALYFLLGTVIAIAANWLVTFIWHWKWTQ